jgi:hypothetical protein
MEMENKMYSNDNKIIIKIVKSAKYLINYYIFYVSFAVIHKYSIHSLIFPATFCRQHIQFHSIVADCVLLLPNEMNTMDG